MRRSTAVEGRVESARSGREVRRDGVTRDVGAAPAVDRDPVADVVSTPAEIGRVDEGGARRVRTSSRRRRGRRCRSCRRRPRWSGNRSSPCSPVDVGVARAVDGDAEARSPSIAAVSAQVGGVDEGGAARVQLRHERVVVPPLKVVSNAPAVVGKFADDVAPAHVGAARNVDRDASSRTSAAPPAKVCGVARARRRPRSSFVTKASVAPPLKVVSNAPGGRREVRRAR